MQRIQGIDRCRVVIGTLGPCAPVSHHQVQIQEPALDLALAVANLFQGALVEADRRDAGGAGEAFLGTRIDGVDSPLVNLDRRTTQGGHRVNDRQAVIFVGELHKLGDIGLGSGRGLCMHHGDDRRIGMCLESVFQLVAIDRLSPGILDHDRRTAATFNILLHAPTKDAILAHDHLVARFHQVDEAGFHSCRSGCRHRHRHGVAGLKGVLQQFLEFIHHADEFRV